MDSEVRGFEFPSEVLPVSGVPARRPRPMIAQAIEVWTPRSLFAAMMTGLFASRPAAVLVPLKRDA